MTSQLKEIGSNMQAFKTLQMKLINKYVNGYADWMQLKKELNESLTNMRSKTKGTKVNVTDADSFE